MLILTLGSEYFHSSLLSQGHKIISLPHIDGFPVDEMYHNMVDRPDLLLYVDHLGQHAWPQGLSEIDIPKIYYAVDTPINYWWQRHFAHLFDLCFVDQKPYVEMFENDSINTRWLPVAIDAKEYQAVDEDMTKIYDFGFVGVVNEKVRPKRSRLIKQLSSRFSLKSMGDHNAGWIEPEQSASLYRQSRMILNENLFPGVTTRMFEAMASGSVLFTEKAGGDLGELFMPGEDFAWFEPQELFEAADYWLKDDERLNQVARRAREKVISLHDVQNRLEIVLNAADGLRQTYIKCNEKTADHEGKAMFWTAMRWPGESGKDRLLRAEQLLLKAAHENYISSEGMFMLGHIGHIKNNSEQSLHWLNIARDAGFPRASLGLGFIAMSQQKQDDAQRYFGEFCGMGQDFPKLEEIGLLPVEAIVPIADKLMDLGYKALPGFDLRIHDPSVWTALEFYVAAHSNQPNNLKVGQRLSSLLLDIGAPAEAANIAAQTLEHHPADITLSQVYASGATNSYMSIN